MNNNFDTNSNGVNIEVSCIYDCHISQMDFNENLESLGGKDTEWFYNSHKQMDVDSIYDFSYSFTDEKAVREFLDKECHIHFDESDYVTFQDYLDDIMAEWKACEGNEQVQEWVDDSPITMKRVNDVEIYETRGYSQGDYARVFIDWAQFAELITSELTEETKNAQREYIDHLFWDAPIHGVATINDVEYYYEFDSYDFKRSEWIESILKDFQDHEKLDVIKNDLESLIPENLEYTH